MAVVKTNYVQAKKAGSRQAIKESIDYMTHRPNKEGETVDRTLFGPDGPLEKELAYQMIEAAGDNIYFYRMMISLDPTKEDGEKTLDLWALTQKTIEMLEKRLGIQLDYIAVEHNDQTEIRHIHSIVLIPRRLTVKDLEALRLTAGGLALSQQLQPEQGITVPVPETEYIPPQQVAETPAFTPVSAGRPIQADKGPVVGMPTHLQHTCPLCGPTQTMWKVGTDVYRCGNCALVLSGEYKMEIEIPKLYPSLRL